MGAWRMIFSNLCLFESPASRRAARERLSFSKLYLFEETDSEQFPLLRISKRTTIDDFVIEQGEHQSYSLQVVYSRLW